MLREMGWLELKLLVREPLTVIFTLALPVIILFVLGGVFGNTAGMHGATYRGVGAMNFYIPAYVGLVVTSMGLIGIPSHLSSYRERGVLRRWHASAMPTRVILASQLLVTAVVSVVGAGLLIVLGRITYDVAMPDDWAGVAVAFVAGVLAFTALGVLLGAVIPTARAAQGAGIILWFVMLMVAGAGPPPEVLPAGLTAVATFLPLTHLVLALQDPWLGFGSNLMALTIIAVILVACAGASLRLFRRE